MNMRQTDGMGVARLMRYRANWHSERAREAMDMARLDPPMLPTPNFTEQYEFALATHFQSEGVRFEREPSSVRWSIDTDSLTNDEVEIVWGPGASTGQNQWAPSGRRDSKLQDGPIV